MVTDDLWFRRDVPGAGVRTPGEAKSRDELDWAVPAREEPFANENPDELNKMVTLLEKEGPRARIYGEGVVLQGKLKFFKLRVAGRECGVVLPNGESERLGELHSVAKDVWFKILKDAEAAWSDPEGNCKTWGYVSPLQMAARFLMEKPYVVYGERRCVSFAPRFVTVMGSLRTRWPKV